MLGPKYVSNPAIKEVLTPSKLSFIYLFFRPLPKNSEAPQSAPYSGLLECPLTDKIAKVFPGGNNGWTDTFAPTLFQCTSNSNTTRCPYMAANATECFAAAQAAVGNAVTIATASGPSDTLAAGCTITYGQ